MIVISSKKFVLWVIMSGVVFFTAYIDFFDMESNPYCVRYGLVDILYYTGVAMYIPAITIVILSFVGIARFDRKSELIQYLTKADLIHAKADDGKIVHGNVFYKVIAVMAMLDGSFIAVLLYSHENWRTVILLLAFVVLQIIIFRFYFGIENKCKDSCTVPTTD